MEIQVEKRNSAGFHRMISNGKSLPLRRQQSKVNKSENKRHATFGILNSIERMHSQAQVKYCQKIKMISILNKHPTHLHPGSQYLTEYQVMPSKQARDCADYIDHTLISMVVHIHSSVRRKANCFPLVSHLSILSMLKYILKDQFGSTRQCPSEAAGSSYYY